MPCYHPISLPWVAVTRLPCGSCLGCRADQSREWAIRILKETQMHPESWFLTLTYSDDKIPENGSLNPQDLRAFYKNLRRSLSTKLSYFACGEYGEKTQRPHYHSVLYGPHLLDRYHWRTIDGNHYWRSATLEEHWPHGTIEFSTVSAKSAAYVAGYVRKKISKKANPNHYTRVDEETGELVQLHPEFNRMSLKPAIGKRWIEKYWTEVYPKDFVTMGGKEYRPPRYFDRWMEENHPEIMIEVKLERDKNAKYIPEEKLTAKEKIHASRDAIFKKRATI